MEVFWVYYRFLRSLSDGWWCCKINWWIVCNTELASIHVLSGTFTDCSFLHFVIYFSFIFHTELWLQQLGMWLLSIHSSFIFNSPLFSPTHRALKTPIRKLTNSHKNVLDGQLLQCYVQMCFQERFDIARKMGTTPAQVCGDTDVTTTLWLL